MPERRRDGIAQPATIPESLRAKGKAAEQPRSRDGLTVPTEKPRTAAHVMP